MIWWQTALIALGSSLLGGVVVTIVQAWFRRGERAADIREKRREEAGRIVGPAFASLRDLEPNANVGALRGNERAQEALEGKWDRWLAAAGVLEVLGATHPDSDVAELSESVISKGTDLLARLHIAIQAGGAQEQAWWDAVNSLRDEAMAEARQLVRAVLDQPA